MGEPTYLAELNRYMEEYIFVYAFYDDSRRPRPYGRRRGGNPRFVKVWSLRKHMPSALSHLYDIPEANLILFDFHDRHPIALAPWDIIEGMAVRLENIGVTIDRGSVPF
ncbi:hypothetical protein NPIL_356321 [Nephila pilipes]|uniref:Uncharacterized protein n=1 Tax=Nephila pilipes TaxID=299642 RepID=A0A8X6UNU2_NEPPI|nr:hypothetical protein NPIL_356321 [Nephila pilipes]